MITPTAPAFWALRIFTVKSQSPRPSSAILPVRSGSGGLAVAGECQPVREAAAGSGTTASGAVRSLVELAEVADDRLVVGAVDGRRC